MVPDRGQSSCQERQEGPQGQKEKEEVINFIYLLHLLLLTQHITTITSQLIKNLI